MTTAMLRNLEILRSVGTVRRHRFQFFAGERVVRGLHAPTVRRLVSDGFVSYAVELTLRKGYRDEIFSIVNLSLTSPSRVRLG